jgi:type IV secretion system protein TrbI
VNGPESEGAGAEEARPAGPVQADAFRLAAEPPAVMRLSRRTLAILGGASGILIGGALLYALQPATSKSPENLVDSDRPNKSELVTGAPADYGKVPKLGAPLPGDLGRPILAAQQQGETVAVPPMGPHTAPDPKAAEAAQARARLAQEHEAARESRLFLGGALGSPTASSPPDIAAGVSPPAAQEPSSVAGRRRGFLAEGGARPVESVARIANPSSPHVIQAGSVIPAALLTGIRSDLPGQVTAQVTQNVYDSPTGRTLLIPQGARLVGEYDSEIAAGQSRVLLAWDRLILPGGRSILLDRLPGTDAGGMAGVTDRTDYHWGHMLKAALVSTLLGVGAELGSSDADRFVQAARRGTQDSLNETGRQLVERQLAVPPTITVRPGAALRILVTRDMILEPLRGESR